MAKALKVLDKVHTVKTYKKLIPYLKMYWPRVLLALAVTLPVGSLDAAVAWILRPYMDQVLIGRQDVGSAFFPLLIIGFSILQSLLNYASTYLNTWVGQKMTMTVKKDLFKKLVTSDSAFFDRSTSGDIIFRYNSDVDLGCASFLANARNFIIRIVSSISLIIVLFMNSVILATVAIVILGIAVYPLALVRKRLRKVFERSVFAGSYLFTNYNEAYNGNRVIAAYNLQDYMSEKLSRTLNGLFSIGMKLVQRNGGLSIFMHTVIAIGIAATIWLQNYLISVDKLTPGNFVSFITALLMLYTPIKKLGNNYNQITMSIMGLERVFDKMESVPSIRDKPDAHVLNAFQSEIKYEDVKFSYLPDRPVLKGVNLTIERGETVAFVGNSGGGKTTIVNLLPRFYDVTGGGITIDGIDIRDLTIDSLRDKIAVVFQDNFLFSGTILENITLGRQGSTREEAVAAVKAACLDDFISSLPEGLDTQVGERGILLSGGQKQRVAIARAFIKQSPIVILDEATSALDNKSEAIVQQAIENLMCDRTVLIVAHRLTTVINADMIVVVNDGMIKESGTHQTLFSNPDGIYRSLYENQFK